jgi:trimeric autotransporter adhesin
LVTTAVVVIAALVLVGVFVLSGSSGPSAAGSTSAADAPDHVYAQAPGAVTLAGTGAPGYSGDGGSAVDAELDAPAGIVENSSGDLFVADSGNCRVREIATRSGVSFGRQLRAGEIVTVAGGPCSDSANSVPSTVAVDPAGDLFIAYGPAARVEELSATTTTDFGVATRAGKLTVVAGTGVSGFDGDGMLATRSELYDPTGLAVDREGDLLVADTANCRLRLVAASNGTRFGIGVLRGHIYTVAGSGSCGSAGDGGPARDAQLWDPGALAVDAQGDVLVADQGNRTIRLLAARTGTYFGVTLAADYLGTVAGEGSYGPYLNATPAVGPIAELNFPSGIALDRQGNLYIADGSSHAIRFVPAAATTLSGEKDLPDAMYTAAGAVPAGSESQQTKWIQTRMLEPTGIVVSSSGRLIYSDSGAHVVRELPAGT